jgi:hypothetical protein
MALKRALWCTAWVPSKQGCWSSCGISSPMANGQTVQLISGWKLKYHYSSFALSRWNSLSGDRILPKLCN